MKKNKLICSAIAAFAMLALAGCDMKIPEQDLFGYLQGDMVVETLPFTNSRIVKDATLSALDGAVKSNGEAWTKADGVSLSFFLSGYSDDWSMIFQVPSANFGTTTMHQCNNKIWVKNSYGCSAGNGAWDQFLNVDCYITISIDYTAGTMTFYKDGELVTVYGGEVSPYGAAGWEMTITGKEWVQGIINDICDSGIYCIHPTDSWAFGKDGDYQMTSFEVDVAVDADGAKAKYDAYKAQE